MTMFNDMMFARRKAGFTVLFAVLMSSLLLAIGISIFNIVRKEQILSSAGRESQFAFYAADSGVECALFWDLDDNAFATSSSKFIECNRDTLTDPRNDGNRFRVGGADTSSFTIRFYPANSCATVTVTKGPASGDTVIVSEGYNTCDENDERRVERTLRVSYQDEN